MTVNLLASGILPALAMLSQAVSGELRTAQLLCRIGDNGPLGEHQAHYNGVFSLCAPDCPENAFVPSYAGLNLEHYFDAGPHPENREVFFEPRHAPMSFRQVSKTAIELHQQATPRYGIESWTRFDAREPYYLDMTFRCIPRKAGLDGGCFGVFWASYINAPMDKSIYFLGGHSTFDKPVWTQYCTLEHGRDSTVRRETDDLDIPFAGGGGTLYSSIAHARYSEPFFYGRFRDKVLIYIFESDSRVRFSHSPSGGGATQDGTGQNPAWDFQLVVPKYEVGKEYGLKVRLVYKPWVDRKDVLDEARKFLRR